MPDRGFPRTSRLLTAADYAMVFEKSRRRADKFWTVLIHECGKGQDKPAKLGLAIAKKRAKRAVDRNRLKRIARETFRQQRFNLNGRYLVIMNRDAAVYASKAELQRSLDRILRAL